MLSVPAMTFAPATSVDTQTSAPSIGFDEASLTVIVYEMEPAPTTPPPDAAKIASSCVSRSLVAMPIAERILAAETLAVASTELATVNVNWSVLALMAPTSVSM